ncbi:molybdate ABC transporter substrate-binding protein [Priestia megaterium]|uniref:Molybdate ABC transporter substrate-binding protein n=1 Tax=Priestia megaterium TaxID=1404 RepID=A0A6H1P7P6_PRIMG|nr:molybdate ABC transporter substrate-binding protein [Priestia megaterium]QIZ09548.1 molybdate ABC transporter substrate-binding protein [Priestia megaterium]
MKKKCLIWFFMITMVFLPACSTSLSEKDTDQTKKSEITISAAASLGDALNEIKSQFEKTNKQITLLYNLGGSGALKQQIIQGAPADIFISASKDQFDDLSKKGLIAEQKQKDLLSNQIVLITNKMNPAPLNSFQDLKKSGINKIAIGTPETVPAGMYAKQTLQNLDIWDGLQSKIIQTKDVRQVLTYVETKSVDAGIVYLTDLKVSEKVKVVAVAAEQSHDRIIYSAGIIKSSEKKKEVSQFYDYLQTPTARAIFKKYGFKVLD